HLRFGAFHLLPCEKRARAPLSPALGARELRRTAATWALFRYYWPAEDDLGHLWSFRTTTVRISIDVSRRRTHSAHSDRMVRRDFLRRVIGCQFGVPYGQ